MKKISEYTDKISFTKEQLRKIYPEDLFDEEDFKYICKRHHLTDGKIEKAWAEKIQKALDEIENNNK